MIYYLDMIRGDTLSFGIELEGLEQNLESAYFTVKKNLTDDTPVLQKSIGDGIHKLYANYYIVRVAPEDTENVEAGQYYYDMEVSVNGDVYTVLDGVLCIDADVTRGESHGGGSDVFSILNNLVGVTTDNPTDSVKEGDSYLEFLSVPDGYLLDNVVVTMAGIDITDTAYAVGSIHIPEVTGDVVVSAIAEAVSAPTYLYNWDFRTSMVDSVGGLTARLRGGATQDSNGVHLNNATDAVLLDANHSIFQDGRTVEFQIGQVGGYSGTSIGRLFTVPRSQDEVINASGKSGFVFNFTRGWSWNYDGWTDGKYATQALMQAKTVKLIKKNNSIKVYVQNILYLTANGDSDLTAFPYIAIGSTYGNAFRNIAIKSCRIYENVNQIYQDGTDIEY